MSPRRPPPRGKDELLIEISRVLFGQPTDEVMPALSTAMARCLVAPMSPRRPPPKDKDELLIELSRILFGQPTDQVMPALITAIARCLVIDANGDLDQLDNNSLKAFRLVRATIADMLNQDMDEAMRATKN